MEHVEQSVDIQGRAGSKTSLVNKSYLTVVFGFAIMPVMKFIKRTGKGTDYKFCLRQSYPVCIDFH